MKEFQFAGRSTSLILIATLLTISATQAAAAQDYEITASALNAGNPVHPNSTTSYAATDSSSTGGIQIFEGDDPGTLNASTNYWSPVYNMPFSVSIGGQSFSQLCVSKNGLVTFTTSVANTPVNTALNFNTSLPNVALPDNTICAYWGNFAPPISLFDDIDVHIVGSAPNRQLLVKYYSWKIDSQSFMFFGVVFNEGSDIFHVVDMYDSSTIGTFTIGIQLSASVAFEATDDIQGSNNPSPNQRPGGNSFNNTDNEYFMFEPVPNVEINDDFEAQPIWAGALLTPFTVSAFSGTPPYRFSINNIQHANWMTIDAAAGTVSGLAPLSAESDVQFSVTVLDDKGKSATSSVKSFRVFPVLPQDYSQSFDAEIASDYQLSGGERATQAYLPTGGVLDSGAAEFSASDNLGWSVLSGTASDVLAWQGTVALSHLHVMEFYFDGPGATSGSLRFDYRIQNDTASDSAAALGVLVSDNEGFSWRVVSGPNAESFGGYRAPSDEFASEKIPLSLSGTQDRIGVRVLALVRNTADLTNVVIDNVAFSIPVEITTKSLIATQAEVPMTPQRIYAIGGDQANYSWSEDPANPLPSGLVLTYDSMGAVISGIPGFPESGSILRFGVRLDDGGDVVTQQITMQLLSAPPALNIASGSLLPSSTAGEFAQWQLVASGGLAPYTWSFADPAAAPVWLSIDANSGLLSGVPEAGVDSLQLAVRVVDSDERTQEFQEVAEKTFAMVFSDRLRLDPRVFANLDLISLPEAQASKSYNLRLPIVGGTAPYSWSLKPGSTLPAGIQLTSEGDSPILRGALAVSAATGSPYFFRILVNDAPNYLPSDPLYDPTVTSSGTQNIELSFRLEVSQSTFSTFTLTTPLADIPNQMPRDEAFSTYLSAAGGFPPYTFGLTGSSLGFVTLSSSGLLSIDPMRTNPGNYVINVEVFDTSSDRRTVAYPIELIEAYSNPIITAPLTLPAAAVSGSYSYTFKVSGGEGPFHWRLVGGTDADGDGRWVSNGLPAGLTFRPVGAVLSGIVRHDVSPGIYGLEVEVTDNRGSTIQQSYSIQVTAAVAAPVQIVTSELPTAVLNRNYGAAILASGGIGTLTWRLASGSDQLPEGLFLQSSGSISGIPSLVTGAPVTITLEAIDESGAIASGELTIEVTSDGTGASGTSGSSDGVAGQLSNSGGGSCSVDGGSSRRSSGWFLFASLSLLSLLFVSRLRSSEEA